MKYTCNVLDQRSVECDGVINPNTLILGRFFDVLKYIKDKTVTLVLTNPPFAPAMINTSVSPGKKLLKELKRIVKDGGAIVTIAPTKKKITDTTIEQIIEAYSKKKDIVLDFSMGQGQVGVAAQKLERQFVGIESDEKMFNKACKKIENYPARLKDYIEKKPKKPRKPRKKKEPQLQELVEPVVESVEVKVEAPKVLKGDFEQMDMFE